jgi:hypothetical protein
MMASLKNGNEGFSPLKALSTLSKIKLIGFKIFFSRISFGIRFKSNSNLL